MRVTVITKYKLLLMLRKLERDQKKKRGQKVA